MSFKNIVSSLSVLALIFVAGFFFLSDDKDEDREYVFCDECCQH